MRATGRGRRASVSIDRAESSPIRTEIEPYPLERANEALENLRAEE